jgi:CyaY protein
MTRMQKLDEARFDRLAADELKALDKALGDLDERLEVDLGADILKLQFEDGPTYIVNSHRAARQIWLAANVNAWHFSPDEATGKWIDTREGRELWAVLADLIGTRFGRTVELQRGH